MKRSQAQLKGTASSWVSGKRDKKGQANIVGPEGGHDSMSLR